MFSVVPKRIEQVILPKSRLELVTGYASSTTNPLSSQEFLQRKLAALSEKSLDVQTKNERYRKSAFLHVRVRTLNTPHMHRDNVDKTKMLEALQEEQAANQERLFDLEKRYLTLNLSVYLHFEV